MAKATQQKKEKYLRQRADGTWEARIKIGIKADGSSDIPSRYFSTRTEARAYVKSVLEARARGELHKKAGITLSEWCDRCMELYGPTIQDSTYKGYLAVINTHIKPSALGKLQLDSITRAHVQSWVNTLQRGDTHRSTGELSPKTIRNAMGVLSWLFTRALESEVITKAPDTSLVRLPRPQKAVRKVMDPDTAKALITAAQGHIDYAAYMVDAATGLRRSELLGLCWDAVDLNTGDYSIKRKVTRDRFTNAPKLVGILKTDQAERAGRLPEQTLVILRHHKAAQAEARLSAGNLWEDNNLLFPDQYGRPQTPNNFSTRLYNLQKKYKMEKIGINGFRHLMATTLIRARLDDATIAAALGHKNANFTRQQYADVYEDSKKQVADVAAALLNNLQ